MTSQGTAIIALASLILYVVFSTQVLSSLGGFDQLPARLRAILMVTSPSRSRTSRAMSVALASILAGVGQLGVLLIIMTRFGDLSPDQLVVLAADITLAGLWTAYLLELGRRGRGANS